MNETLKLKLNHHCCACAVQDHAKCKTLKLIELFLQLYHFLHNYSLIDMHIKNPLDQISTECEFGFRRSSFSRCRLAFNRLRAFNFAEMKSSRFAKSSQAINNFRLCFALLHCNIPTRRMLHTRLGSRLAIFLHCIANFYFFIIFHLMPTHRCDIGQMTTTLDIRYTRYTRKSVKSGTKAFQGESASVSMSDRVDLMWFVVCLFAERYYCALYMSTTCVRL